MSLNRAEKVLKPASGPTFHELTRYQFGPFLLDQTERKLWRDGQTVPVTAKVFDTLTLLLQNAGRLVEKSDIIEAIWPDSFVEEGSLTVNIHMLRKALGDDGHEPRFVETIAKRGYRFIADVQTIAEPAVLPEAIPPVPSPTVGARALSLLDIRNRLSGISRSSIRLAGLLIVILALTMFALRITQARSASLQIHSLLVLPFHNAMSGSPRDYVGIGLTDAIVSRLSTVRQLRVVPTNSVLEYADSPPDPISAGKEQKAEFVLAGQIQEKPDQVQISAQLRRVSDGTLLWQGTLGESPQRISSLEGAIEKQIADTLKLPDRDVRTLTVQKQHLPDAKAYQLYLQGRYFWNKRTEEGLRRSIEYFQQATFEDSGYAIAYAGLADSYALLGSYGVAPAEEAYPIARSAALRALQLDASLAEAHASLGMISFYYEWNWDLADTEFRRSIALNPEYALAHTWYGVQLAAVGKGDEAIHQIKIAQQLDPLSLLTNTEVGRVYYLTHNFDAAVDAFRRAIDLDPHFARAHTRLGMAYAAQGKYKEAAAEFQVAQQLSGNDPYLEGLLGFTYGMSGNTQGARRLLAELNGRSTHEFVPAFSQALVYLGLGEHERAIEMLRKSFTDRSTYLVYARTDPLLDGLRADPRFVKLLRDMQLPG